MTNLLAIQPFSRINDDFISNEKINSSSENITATKHDLITGGPNDLSTRYQADFYRYIAVDIVVETVYNYPYAYITEKTLRPIACKRMFIIVGAPGTLQLLKQKGFQTFNDFINEGYDIIDDPEKRFFAISQEIDKILNTPLDVIKEYMTSNSEKLEHNFLTLTSLQEKELQQISAEHNIHYDPN